MTKEQQIYITTHNGSNACHILDWLYLPCFGHNLYLAITNAVKDDPRVARALRVIMELIAPFAHSWNKKNEISQTDLR